MAPATTCGSHRRRSIYRTPSSAGLPLQGACSHGLCVAPGCTEQGPVPANAAGLCRKHRVASSFPLNGLQVRFCVACKCVHPIEDFSASKNACRVAELRLHKILHSMRRQREQMEGRAAKSLRIITSHGKRVLANLGYADSQASDPGRRVWGVGLLRFLRAETIIGKVTMVVLYPTSIWLLNWEQPRAWITVLGSFVIFHVLLPFVHKHCYVASLKQCRQAAEQCGLAVTQGFRILDPEDDAKFEKYTEKLCSTDSVALFVYVSCFFLHFASASFRLWGTWPTHSISTLLIIGALFFPLDEHARKTGQHSLRRRLECALVILSHFAIVVSPVFGWLANNPQCGTPQAIAEIQIVLLCLSFDAVDTAARAAFSRWPLPMGLGVGVAFQSLFIAAFHVSRWCAESKHGVHLSSLAFGEVFTGRSAIMLADAAFRIQREKRNLLRFVGAEQTEAELRPGEDHESSQLRVVFKMQGVTPSHLRRDLHERLAAATQVEPAAITGVIRPGCVMLGLTVQAGTWGRMHEAWSSMLSHHDWGETLLQEAAPKNISLNHQGSTMLGQVEYTAQDAEPPSIAWVNPLVASRDDTAVTLGIAGLDGSGFKVLLRTAHDYYDLEVLCEERRRPGASTTVAVSLPFVPDNVQPGVGWLEVMMDTDDSSLVLSAPLPVMFTPIREVAEEMNQLLPANDSVRALHLGCFLEDVSTCLHKGRE
eukprot:CAMPEP_0117697328 /NCGR_PEP_ID=MMETSP0804-20121206/29166_1 /TAXON_ID=1074897 /ORGANISM="Tetraselmis astigmatica, Strain CCMP880" /LENGTH=706 /DNA_ID=CAMNT_0005511563 /DNA_START=361 /DNA_END=2479 /DNA_ORIENTATION=-